MWYKLKKDIPGFGKGLSMDIDETTDCKVHIKDKLALHLTKQYVEEHPELFKKVSWLERKWWKVSWYLRYRLGRL